MRLHRQKLGLLEEALVKIGAQRGDHPDAAGRHELRQQLGEACSLGIVDLAGEQLIELIDHDQKIGPHRPVVAALLALFLADPVEGLTTGLAQLSSAWERSLASSAGVA